MQGRYSQAISNGEKALSLSDSMGNLWAMGHSHKLLGYLHLVLNQVDDARAHLQTSVELFQKLGQQDELSQALAWMIYVELARHEIGSARAYLTQCLDIVLEVRTILPLLEALPAIAKFLCLQEEIELAVEIYALTMTSPMLANAALIQDLIGSFMDAITKPLPPEAVAAAQERGRQRDLWETAAELLAQFTDRAR
jgi:tetratricopeptide (TPR) repeat protein